MIREHTETEFGEAGNFHKSNRIAKSDRFDDGDLPLAAALTLEYSRFASLTLSPIGAVVSLAHLWGY